MSRYSVYLALIAAVALIAVTRFKAVDLLNLFIPRQGYTVFSDISYGPVPRQKLDVYVPKTLEAHHSAIVFFYGGSWQSGNKEMYQFVGQALASKGFVTIVVDYRLYPQIYFPEFINDGAKALVWAHKNGKHYGADPEHIFLAGHSAGAHIASLLATDKHYLQAQKADVSWIKGVIGIAGPYDFLPFTDPKIKALFSKVDDAETQPINFVTKNIPPFLLATGADDEKVLPKNTLNLVAKLQHFNIPVIKIIYPKIGHIGIILSLAAGFRYKTTLLEDITAFIEQVNAETELSENLAC